MKVLFFVIVFATIIGLLAIRRPLYQAILGGLLLTIIFYKIPLWEAGGHVVSVVRSWSSLSVLVAFYLISFFQRVLDARSQLKLAQNDLNGIFHNRRINTAGICYKLGAPYSRKYSTDIYGSTFDAEYFRCGNICLCDWNADSGECSYAYLYIASNGVN